MVRVGMSEDEWDSITVCWDGVTEERSTYHVCWTNSNRVEGVGYGLP